MKVSIVIPCYNEKNTIEKIIEAVRSAPIESRKVVMDQRVSMQHLNRCPELD